MTSIKQIGTICFAIISTILISHNAFSEDVGMAWYDNGSTISGPSSCTVGGTFVPPTPPARPGYEFTGWKALVTCGIKNFDVSIAPTARGYVNINGSSRSDNYASWGFGKNAGGNIGWIFSYGAIYGWAECSVTTGTRGIVGSIEHSIGRNCWCKATGFTRSGDNYASGAQCNVTETSVAVYLRNFSGTEKNAISQCKVNCANLCSTEVNNYSDFREAVFLVAGQQ